MTAASTSLQNPSVELERFDAARPAPFVVTEPPRILVVEDDPAMSELIGRLLTAHWFKCTIRCSGAQGIRAFGADSVDLIITDLRMRAGDGIALIQTIRRTSQVPIIIVTGFEAEYAEKVRFLNKVSMIKKPFEPSILLNAVERALDKDAPPAPGASVHALSASKVA